MGFKFPIPPGYATEPIWTGNGFLIGSEKRSILKYTECEIGWDASLTDFHEKEAEDGSHYIDQASRLHACNELKNKVHTKSAVILEIGSSSGYLLREIKMSFPDSFLIGSDCIPEPLENIAKKISDIPLIQFDLVNCPLPDNCVDVVVALNVLEHIKEDENALRQINRILKPEGYAIIEVPANRELYDFYDEQLRHFRRYSLPELKTLTEEAGFAVVHASHLGFFIYPGFKYMKLRNRQKKNMNDVQKQTSMKKMIKFGGPVINNLFYLMMKVELTLGNFFQYPQGIRCLLLLKKEIE
jgi:ubiquinone/menaquinone biosynthesis C-methylase UbiE